MNPLRQRAGLLAAAALLSVATASQAATFDISYTFPTNGSGTQDVISGTVDGTLNGSFIDGISNIHLSYDGDAFAGTLSIAAWDAANSGIDTSTAGRISTDASLNEFIITGSTGDYEFLFANNDATLGSFVLAADDLLTVNNAAFDPQTTQASWSVTPAAVAVPEPSSVALLLAGLGLVGAAARRRRA